MIRWLLIFVCALVLTGCASTRPLPSATRKAAPAATAFRLGRDNFAFFNELEWHYAGYEQPVSPAMQHSKRTEPYTWHCIMMSRAANQFFRFARFDPDAPKLSRGEYILRIREVMHTPSWYSPYSDKKRIEFPGFKDLYEFSTYYSDELRDNIGGTFSIFFRPGIWRTTLGANGHHQLNTAARILDQLDRGLPCHIYITNLPRIELNHAVLAYDYEMKKGEITLICYDPNYPEPLKIHFNPQRRHFFLPKIGYFEGGFVAVYRIYRNWLL